MSTSAVWEDKFIDILMIILDHSPSHSSTAIPHTLVSRRASAPHLSVKRNDKSGTAELLEAEYRGAGHQKPKPHKQDVFLRTHASTTSSCWSFKSDYLICRYVIKVTKHRSGNALIPEGAGKFTGNYIVCYSAAFPIRIQTETTITVIYLFLFPDLPSVNWGGKNTF